MHGPDTSKHCVTNMAAGEEAAIAAIIAAIFLVNKEEEENRETVLDLPNVLAVLYTKERRHIPRITGFLYETSVKKTSYFWYNEIKAMFHCVQKCNLIFFSGRDVFESAALISPSPILDFHSQHSVHSAPGSRMDGMTFCPFRNRNAE